MREEEIRPADLFQEYLSLSIRDVATHFADISRENVPCPGCGQEKSRPAFEKLGFGYVECEGCRTLYQSPRPSIESFSRFYSDSVSAKYWAEVFFPAVKEVRRERIFRPRVEMISRLCRERGVAPRVVVEVGAGHGIFLEEWRRANPESSVAAVEPNKEMARVCRENGIEVLEAMAEQAGAWHGKADLLVCFEVIEHVHNAADFVSALLKLVKPGGYLAMTGLGVEGFDIQVLWERSNSVSPPHHLNFLSCDGFAQLLRNAGFAAVDVSTPGRLDVDIVYNSANADASVLSAHRFERTLLSRGDQTRAAFQKFLSEHQLSSHMLALAQR
ncbi:MAG TPA: class I SAM-dependent methyltransferase [Burkholderiales bacterium]|nr:class I SAM-dependent methyltransferase [Burkholderiales bacterium]